MDNKKDTPKWSSDTLPDDVDQLKRIIRIILNDDARNAQKQEESLNAMKSLLSSWRGRIGHMVMSIVEKAMRRKNIRLAADEIISILETLVSRNRDRDNLGLAFVNTIDTGDLVFYYGDDAKEQYTQKKIDQLDLFLKSEQRLDFRAQHSPQVTILLVLYNRAELTLACLQSILSSVSVPLQLVLVDNASSDRTSELLDRLDGVTVIKNDSNEGFLKACNKGALSADGGYLLFLNNDAVLMGDALKNAMQVFREETNVGAVGGKILLLNGDLQEAGSIVWSDGSCLGYGRECKQYEPEYMFRRDVDYCSGAFLLTKRELFSDMGGFDLEYAPAYYEETDYCLKLHEHGFRVVYDPKSVIIHYEFASTQKSNDAIKLQKKNQKIFIKKHENMLVNKLKPKKIDIVKARFYENSKKVLYIDDRVPHQYYGSGFPRSNFILSTLVRLGYQVTLYPINFPAEDNWNSAYLDIPESVEIMLGYGRKELSDHLSARRAYYDIIFVSRPHNMEFFSQIAKKIYASDKKPRVIYDAEAIFSLRDAKKYELFSGREHKNVANNVAAEIALVADADLVVAVSNKERKIFRKYYNGDVGVIGHALEMTPIDTAFEDRFDFLFVGNMDYDGSPNVDSMTWFSEYVFPIILREIPQAKLVLVGTNESAEIQELASENIILMGRQPDLDEYYSSCRVFLAPTRFAGGIPYKVHEASAKGIPVVGSELIRMQLDWTNGTEILSAEISDPAEFASRCIELYQDKSLWTRIRSGALARMKEECSEKEIEGEIEQIFKRVQNDD